MLLMGQGADGRAAPERGSTDYVYTRLLPQSVLTADPCDCVVSVGPMNLSLALLYLGLFLAVIPMQLPALLALTARRLPNCQAVGYLKSMVLWISGANGRVGYDVLFQVENRTCSRLWGRDPWSYAPPRPDYHVWPATNTLPAGTVSADVSEEWENALWVHARTRETLTRSARRHQNSAK